MLIEIVSSTITPEAIELEAINLDNVILCEDLFADSSRELVNFRFDREANNGGEMKYLFKICSTQSRLKTFPSFGEKIQNLPGSILNISNSFIVKD